MAVGPGLGKRVGGGRLAAAANSSALQLYAECRLQTAGAGRGYFEF